MPRHIGAMVRQQIKHWEKLGISRATWYRYGKPTEKAVYDDLRWVMRVMSSPLRHYVERGEVSIAKADRSLADPAFMRRFHNIVADAQVAGALKLFAQERRNDISAQAIADHLNKPVEIVIEALKRLDSAKR